MQKKSVDALYPSIDVDFAIEKCLDIIFKSDIIFKGIDFSEVSLYLSLNVRKEELERENLLEFCPTRNIRGRPPTITSSGKHNEYDKRWKNWNKPLRTATDEMNRKLLMKAFEIALKLVMKNHIFTFNNECFKQLKGGAIGVSIAGDVANLFMVWWDREFKKRLISEKIVLKLYSRYVDDGNIIVYHGEDKSISEKEPGLKEKEIMENIKIVGNSIHPSISVKVDYPSNHLNKRLPILDTEMWIEEVVINDTIKHQVLYSYYEKEMCSKYLIHKNSALSNKSKINIVTNDLVRVMKNTSFHVKSEERLDKIQYFINKMQFSGYGKRDRIHVYNKAKKIFNERTGNCNIYPHKDKLKKIKDLTREKIHMKQKWFSKGKYKSLFYVNATPNSNLAKSCQKILYRCGVPIRVMEKSGQSIKRTLVRSNPFKSKKCNDETCVICISSNSKINCRSRDVVYENFCEHHETCNGVYIGETADPIKERFKEHLDDCRLRPTKSAMAKHSKEKHNDEKVNFNVKIRGVCSGDPLLRQCMESVIIRDTKPEMNGRMEWGTSNIFTRKSTSDVTDVMTSHLPIPMHGDNIATSNITYVKR